MFHHDIKRRLMQLEHWAADVSRRHKKEDYTHDLMIQTYQGAVLCRLCDKELAEHKEGDAYMLAWHKEQAAKLENKETDK